MKFGNWIAILCLASVPCMTSTLAWADYLSDVSGTFNAAVDLGWGPQSSSGSTSNPGPNSNDWWVTFTNPTNGTTTTAFHAADGSQSAEQCAGNVCTTYDGNGQALRAVITGEDGSSTFYNRCGDSVDEAIAANPC